MTRSRTGSSLAWLLPRFVLLSAFWGSSFALIKIAVDAGVAPAWVAFARCAVGAVTLVALCVRAWLWCWWSPEWWSPACPVTDDGHAPVISGAPSAAIPTPDVTVRA